LGKEHPENPVYPVGIFITGQFHQNPKPGGAIPPNILQGKILPNDVLWPDNVV
jgi:hypothetical protein